jgi:hypothetical protein
MHPPRFKKQPYCLFIALFFCLLLAVPGSAVQVNAVCGAPGEATLLVSQVPADEKISGIDLHFSSLVDIAAILATSPDSGVWSQIQPVMARTANEVRIASIAPTVINCAITARTLIYSVRLTFADPRFTPKAIHEFLDSVWIGSAIGSDGQPRTVECSQLTTAVLPGNAAAQIIPVRFSQVHRAYRLSFTNKNAVHVKARIIDLKGTTVALLQDGVMAAGPQVISWNGAGLDGNTVASGTYFVQLEAGTFTFNKKITRVR